MMLNVFVERDADGWFVGSVSELSGCHTQARTIVDLIVRVCEAVCLYLDVVDVDAL
jgi:predicted RNase H-like HicB family nuclease